SIQSEIPNRILKDWEIKIEVDAFANRKNKKAKKFFTINNDRRALAKDALIQNWNVGWMLIHPPISILTRVLMKIMKEGGKYVVIAPMWQTQIWWPLLISMTE
ncbi:MAG: hypothetical protein EZS28_055503, partial [Streblomastix strix]